MKTSANILLSIVLLLMPMVTVAQNYPRMNQADMQKQMQQMQKMQACMQNVDQAKLKEIQQRSEQVNTEIKSLCKSGQRDKAQKKAISFGMEMVKDPTMQEMRKCGEIMKGSMPKAPFMDQYKDNSSHHVCD
ncbi:MAG: hypothetical protein WC560_09235 [Syntrophales bacterium]